MLRILFFGVIRFIIIAFVIYFVLTVIRGIIRLFQGPSESSSFKKSTQPHSENPPQPKEEYKDVKDAKFVELPQKNTKSEDDEKL